MSDSNDRRSPEWADLESGRSALVSRLDLVAQVIGWFCALVGATVVVVGWWLDHPAVASLLPGQVTMKANAAVGIVLSGLVIVGVTRGWRPLWSGIAAGAVLLIGSVTVAEYALHSTWTVFDQMLATEAMGAVQTASPGRMGLNTAVDLILLGTGGILLTFRRAPNARQTLAVLTIFVGVVAVLGYLLEVPQLTGQLVGVLTRMALPTAVLHVLLGLALLTAAGEGGWAQLFASPLSGGRIARTWLPLLVVVMVAIAVVARLAEERSAETGVGHQLGLAMSVVAVTTATLILAARADRLDQDRLFEAATAVERSDRMYELGFGGSPVGIVVVDAAGTVNEVNPAFSALVGRPADAIAGADAVSTLSAPEKVLTNLDVLQQLVSGETKEASLETALVGGDGRSIPVRVDAVRIDFASGPRVFGFVSDLTEIHEAHRELALKNQELAYLAERDPLTGALNRRGFLEHVQSALDDGLDTTSAVLFVDIDGFKTVNDVYGHRVGDRFLCSIAERLIQNTEADGGQVGRLGGDEFAVLFASCGPTAAAGAAVRLTRVVREPVNVDGVTLSASCSIGYAVSDEWSRDCEELMARADQDMYANRRARREGLAERVGELSDGIAFGQLVTHYQPVWALAPAGPTLHGYEALVRWQHPERGLVPPVEFITTAEEGGLIRKLDMWVAKDALAHMGAEPRLSLAVNCSALSLAVPGVAAELIGAVRAVNRDPKSVIVELTESVDIPDNSQIMKSLAELRSAGIRIALDDFGAGYAGLNNLRNLPIDLVKIDRSLIATLATESEQADNTEHFLSGIRQLTRAMGTEVLAEGIETERQLNIVRELGFDFVQGYLLGSPVPGTSLGTGAASRQ